MVPNMKAKYTAEVAPALMKKFQYESAMQIPVSYTHLTLPTTVTV